MKILLTILSIILALTACGSYQETVQIDDKSYLLIIGDPSDSVVIIDDGKPLELGKDTVSFDLNGVTATKIEITIGSHTVKIIKNGKIKVNRKFYVSTGNSFKVSL